MRKSDKNRTDLFDRNFNVLFEDMIAHHRRVLPVRIDLRFPSEYGHDGYNKEISKFHKNLNQNYRDKGIDVRYHTVREQVTSNNPHYHVMLLLDGDKVRKAHGVKKRCGEIWSDVIGCEGEGLVNYCTHKPGHSIPALGMVHRPARKATGDELERKIQIFEESCGIVQKHAAYLNKSHSKNKAPHRVREVFTSQIRA